MTNVRKLYGRSLRAIITSPFKASKDEFVRIFQKKLKKNSGFWSKESLSKKVQQFLYEKYL